MTGTKISNRGSSRQTTQTAQLCALAVVVEVVSPGDLFQEINQKVEEYLGAGVRLVWVIDPEVQTVLIYRADGSIQGLRANDELDGEDVIPGFRCRVGALFVMPAGA